MRERIPDDPPALVAHLFDAHGAALYRYALMLLADPSAAEDALQQVFAALLRPSVRVEGSDPLHYLRRAVRNECYSLLRRRRLRQGDEQAGPLLEAVSESRPPEERLALERSMRDLPPDQREVIHLHVFEGLTFREIASETSAAGMFDPIASQVEAVTRAERQILDRASVVALAVTRYRLAHAGRVPATLAELVPAYLAAVPEDPLAGRPLLFRRLPDAYLVYSVGADGRDDGGRLASELQETIRRGWGLRAIRGLDTGIRVLVR